MKLLVAGCRLIDPKTGRDSLADISFGDDGRVLAIDPAGAAGPAQDGCRLIDARGLVAAPGLVDAHVHFREPGQTHKEDIQSGSAAAAAGGFTTVVCMANTAPVADRAETLALVLEKAAQSKINVKTVAALSLGLSGAQLTDMARLSAMGAVGFSDDGAGLADPALLLQAMEAAKALDAPICLHQEHPGLIWEAGVNAGAAAAALGLRGAPSVAESALVARDSMLALSSGAKTHFQHLSCAESVALVRLAKSLGAPVSAEASPAHFSLTDAAVASKGSLAKVNPPLRGERDRLAIVEGLADGTIDMIATDHAPHGAEEKARPFRQAPSGLIGLETALALGITHLVAKGALSLSQLIERMSLAPARLFGLDAGYVAPGGPGDLTLFDADEVWTVGGFVSKSSNSPFVGQRLKGRVKYAICRGQLVHC